MKRKRLCALMKKDIVTGITDKNSLIMLVTPIFFCVFYSLIMENKDTGGEYFILMLCTIFNLAIVPICVLPSLTADERDKGTITTLYRAGVTHREFLGAKMGSVIILALMNAVVVFLLTRTDIRFLFVYLVWNVIVVITLLPIGAVIAVLAKDQNSANVYSTFPMVLIMLFPVFSTMSDFCKPFSRLLPVNAITGVLIPYMEEATPFERDGIGVILCCIVWFVAGMTVFIYLYKKKGL